MTNILIPHHTADRNMPEQCDAIANCICGDTQARSVAALMAAGMTQRDASLMVYVDWAELRAGWHARFHAWFPWLHGCCGATS